MCVEDLLVALISQECHLDVLGFALTYACTSVQKKGWREAVLNGFTHLHHCLP